MRNTLSIWLDETTAKALKILCEANDRRRGDMVKVLIRRAVRELAAQDDGILMPPIIEPAAKQGVRDDGQ